MAHVIPRPEELEAQNRKAVVKIDTDRFPKLSVRQKRVIEILAENPLMSWQKACREAGYSDKGRLTAVKKRLEGVLGEAFWEVGLTQFDVAKKIQEGINAERHHIKWIPKYDDDGKVVDYRAKVVTVPDYGARAAYVKLASHLGRLEPAMKIEGKVAHAHLHSNVQDLAELRRRRDELAQKVEDVEFQEVGS